MSSCRSVFRSLSIGAVRAEITRGTSPGCALPFENLETRNPRAALHSTRSGMDRQKSDPVTILLVDDDSAVCFAVGMGLVMRGFAVVEAYSADDAMRVCLTHNVRIEAVVIYVEMPT